MKNLLEIARVVTKRKVRKIEIFDDHSLKHKNSMFNQFYEALRDQKFKNDREAAQALYGCGPTDAKYRQLKSRFRKRLLNTLFFLDINLPKTADYDRAYYSCHKDWTLVKTLLWYDAPLSALQLARQILTASLKYQFADIIVNSARILREHSAAEGDLKSFEEYQAHIDAYLPVLQAELTSEELLQKVSLMIKLPKVDALTKLPEIRSYGEQLVKLTEQQHSPVVRFNMYLVWIHYYELQQQYEAMIEVCRQGIQYVNDNPVYKQHKKLIAFHTLKMSAFLHLQNFRDGRTTAEQCLKDLDKGSEEWFAFMEYYFLLAMHTENFTQAVAIFRECFGHSRFRKLSAAVQDKWHIFDGYVNYIIEAEGKRNKILLMQKDKAYRASKVLDHPAIYPREQKVLTLHMLALQVLFLLERRKFGEAGDRIEQLKKFASRQLRKDDYYRPLQFARLLQKYAKAGFQPEEVTSSAKNLQLLREHPMNYDGTIDNLEVIPFERIWERVQTYIL